MRVLIACEYSGKVREAFRALGHDAWSCDLLNPPNTCSLTNTATLRAKRPAYGFTIYRP